MIFNLIIKILPYLSYFDGYFAELVSMMKISINIKKSRI